jgi:hypothetical protein
MSQIVQPAARLDQPWPAEWTVERGRDAYLAENGFTVAAYEDAWTQASLWGLSLKIPNTPHHRWAIRLHDLHHVATGFGTDLTGEAEISAWEARRGLRGLDLYVGAIVSSLALGGLAFAPRRVRRAWDAAERGTTLFNEKQLEYAALLRMTVGELRELLGLPREGIARFPRKLHGLAPNAAAASS